MSATQLRAEAFWRCGFVCGDIPVYDIADNLAGKVIACWPEVEPSRRRHNTASARTPTPPQSRLSRVLFPCSLRQLISIPLSLASIALAYGDKALSYNIDPAFRSLDIAFEKMIKFLMT
ncbi:hypothetical protein ABIB82_007529 [Bradyrhizobium sp. i1.8.4]|uniref:hypothetical protein n=1 Tax=unclassified Bradyrhizobium TaxID=2631580 RepID=UPI003D226EEB